MKKSLFLLLKIVIAITALTYALYQSDVEKLIEYARNIDPLMFIAAFFVLTLAQIVSALRMRYYFKSISTHMHYYFAIALYFVGALYNSILPGGIGGDGYKVLLVRKHYGTQAVDAIRRILSGRANGLFILLILTFLSIPFGRGLTLIPYSWLLFFISLALMISGYFLLIHLLLKEPLHLALGALKYSTIIQLCCVLTAIILLIDLGIDIHNTTQTADYIVVFLISSIISVLPLTIGGVGLRELTFVYGAKFLQLDLELGITFAIEYFIINLLCSFLGFAFVAKLPKATVTA